MTDNCINTRELAYSIGGLLYTPAINDRAADKVIAGTFPCLRSLALCLEDAILGTAVETAEKTLAATLGKLYTHRENGGAGLPLLFVRVRSPEHLSHVHEMLGSLEDILCGYILPKFDHSNAESYIDTMTGINAASRRTVFAMPILESSRIADRSGRISELSEIKRVTDAAKRLILNIRVGGNDLCSLYGVRRTVSQTIYDIGVVRDILTDIINVFSFDHVVSGPVWEYFGRAGSPDERWKDGLERELRLDMLNGFIGKTAVHPSQLPVICRALQPTKSDYDDAVRIINWSAEVSGVGKSSDGTRMNEVKCHRRWAEKIRILGDIYGVKEDGVEKLI